KLAVDLGLAAVVVNPAHVPIVANDHKNSSAMMGCVISLAFGLSTTEANVAETKSVLAEGAEEVDMVLNFSALRSRREAYVLNEIKSVVGLAKTYTKKVGVKVILETCYLNDAEKEKACLMAVEGGADFVKTSTGFGSAGATVSDIR